MKTKILILKRKPVNRHEKRKYEKELAWLKNWYIEEVVPLEHEFWEVLLSVGVELGGDQYKDVYQRYIEKFKSLRYKTNHIRIKFVFLDVDMYYFEKIYKPLENVD